MTQKDRIGEALEKAQGKLLNDRAQAFQLAQEKGQEVTAQRQRVEAEQKELARLAAEFSQIQSGLKNIEAQIALADSILK